MAKQRSTMHPVGEPTANNLVADPLNRAIIDLLRQDGRLPYSTIARELDTSEGTVRNRVSKMIEAGVLRIMAVVGPIARGQTVYALIGLTLSPGADPRTIATPFMDREEVPFVLFAAGRYDLIVEVMCPSQQEMRDLILELCYAQPGIASVEPMMGLELFKDRTTWHSPQGRRS